jgi:serine/threonine protein kinase
VVQLVFPWQMQVVHSDMKSKNVLLSGGMHAKISDVSNVSIAVPPHGIGDAGLALKVRRKGTLY